MLFTHAQTALLKKALQTLREDNKLRLKDRESAEAKYRVKASKFAGLPPNEIELRIKQAHATPQKAELLQAIHLAHTRAVEIGDEIEVREQELVAQLEAARERDTNLASLKAELSQKEDKVLARLHVYARPTHFQTESCVVMLLPDCQQNNESGNHAF